MVVSFLDLRLGGRPELIAAGIIAGVHDAAMTLLRLLADDAPAADVTRAAEQLAADDPVAGATARDLAVRVRASMDASKRREAELSALVDVARELASVRDPGGVLDTIVHRARTLVGTDVAYLTLYDEARGDTYMRATDGSVSAAFQQLRLPLGAGLGGLVAETRTPYWTDDYPSDERFRHTTMIDSAVGEEGLVAICGTPLIVDGSFVGVLFASNRTKRPFSRDELSLLGSLAALASVRDPGGVLDTIVHRARTLVGTDVAYLTLYDEARGDTYMRATDGSVSAAFQQLRLPLGAGLGGLVAETRKPYWTADYPADRRFRHTKPIDDAVGEEGLVAICGTPLIVDGDFV
ncbi:MAG: GAF domain-containing protein, partial [Kribbellaceae bacterium]